MQTQRDLTAERLEKRQRVAFSELPFADAIKTVRGKGERVLAVFSDPDCPYCQRLEGELEKLDNLTLYTFAYPLEGLHPDAKVKAVSVWCAPDRARAWAELMTNGKDTG
jgi:thiol:disulfide interchange protein DsbC